MAGGDHWELAGSLTLLVLNVISGGILLNFIDGENP